MNKITKNLMAIFLIALVMFFAGCAGQEITTPDSQYIIFNEDRKILLFLS